MSHADDSSRARRSGAVAAGNAPRAPRRLAVAAILASLGVGCPALVYDPPYYVAAEDAAAGPSLDGTIADSTSGAEDGAAESGGNDAAVPAGDALGVAPDGSTPDAVAEGGTRGDSGCPGVICDGTCVADAGDCSACSGETSLCLDTNVCQSGCAGCGSGATCLLCVGAASAASAPTACGNACLAGDYPHCACTTASGCAVADQTCVDNKCAACGEPSTGGVQCYGRCSPPSKTETCTESSSACTCM